MEENDMISARQPARRAVASILRLDAPGRRELRIDVDCSIKPDGRQHFGKRIQSKILTPRRSDLLALDIVEATAGDVLLFPHDHLHVLGTDLSLTPARTEEIIDAEPAEGLIQMRYGGGGEATRFVCGYLSCDRRMCQPLLNALPQMLRIPLGEDSTSGWIAELLRLGVQELLAQRPGARSLLSKLSELAFVEAMRRYTQSQPPGQKGWLAGSPADGRSANLLVKRRCHARRSRSASPR